MGLTWCVAVLLVDPPISGKIFPKDGGQARQLTGQPEIPPLYPSICPMTILPPDVDSWSSLSDLEITNSMFDNILSSFDAKPAAMPADAVSCTEVCRLIELSKWIGWIDRQSTLAWKAYDKINFLSMRETYRNFSLGPEWHGQWQQDVFAALVHALVMADSIISMIVQNTHSLGMDGDAKRGSDAVVNDYEAAEWQALLRRAATVKQLLSTITDSYV